MGHQRASRRQNQGELRREIARGYRAENRPQRRHQAIRRDACPDVRRRGGRDRRIDYPGRADRLGAKDRDDRRRPVACQCLVDLGRVDCLCRGGQVSASCPIAGDYCLRGECRPRGDRRASAAFRSTVDFRRHWACWVATYRRSVGSSKVCDRHLHDCHHLHQSWRLRHLRVRHHLRRHRRRDHPCRGPGRHSRSTCRSLSLRRPRAKTFSSRHLSNVELYLK